MKREINFFEAARPKTASLSLKSGPALTVLASAALVLALWLLFSALAWGRSDVESPVGDIHAAEINSATQADYTENLLTTSRLQAIFDAQPSDLRVDSFTYEQPFAKLSCWSARELCGADFAASLRVCPGVSEVDYTGVVAVDGGYGFTITFSFAEGGGSLED